MGKHGFNKAKGKHAAGSVNGGHGSKAKGGSSAYVQVPAEEEAAEGQPSSSSQPDGPRGKHVSGPLSSSDADEAKGPAAGNEKAAKEQLDPATDGASPADAGADQTAVLKPQSPPPHPAKPGTASEEASKAAASGPKHAPKETEKPQEAPKGGKHAAPATAAIGGVDAAGTAEANKAARKRRVLAIVACVVLGLLAAAYLAGVFVFSSRFYPNTHAASFDLSLKVPEAIQEELDTALAGYAFEVRNDDGFTMLFTANDIAMDMDAQAISQGILQNMNPWAWPVEVFRSHDETQALAATCAADAIVAKVTPAVELANEDAEPPVDATIAYDEKLGAYQVVPEKYGNTLDPKAIADEIALGIMTFEPVIQLSQGAYLQPEVLKEDPRLKQACTTADAMVKAKVSVLLEGDVAGLVDAPLIAEWIELDDDLVPVLDDDALVEWCDDLVERNSTLGGSRTYERSDGKVVTVSGGTYGWAFDGDGLADDVRSAVVDGTQAALDLPVTQSAARPVTDDHPDWPNRYCDVDLSEQYARLYDDAGDIIWESDIVSGKPSSPTPRGVYVVNGLQSPATLIGQIDPETNEPSYETKVTYWMPFVGNSVGLHDASWQSAFGGSRWCSGFGSHGCVNLPPGKAAEVYGLLQVGDVVVVHD